MAGFITRSEMSDIMGAVDYKALRQEVLEAVVGDVRALIQTVPLELGVVNSPQGMRGYQATVEIVGSQIKITPEPGLAEWMEEGKPPWNVAEAMLRSGAAKRGEDGTRYVDVPLNSGSKFRPNDRSPLTSQQSRKHIQRVTENFVGSRRADQVEEMREGVIEDVQARVRGMGRDRVSDQIYTDRTPKVRRISEKTLTGGKWIHPGFKPTPILESIEDAITESIDRRAADMLAESTGVRWR